MIDVLELIGRARPLFSADLRQHGDKLNALVQGRSFLVLGAAGSIGQAVTKEIFKRQPARLHAVDISENNLTELVRDIRSGFGYITGDFQTFALDIGGPEYQALLNSSGRYDYVLNLSALKHVRSEKDPFTLMRMLAVNVLNTEQSLQQAIAAGHGKYFAVSTDKAANPVNMMGASKRVMELFLHRASHALDISTARFANVAFSDGSLLHGFNQRLLKQQPIVAPDDIKRYFVTATEAAELCLFSCLLGDNRDIFFPKLSSELHLTSFADIAVKFLQARGFSPYLCESEQEARAKAATLPAQGLWPCLFAQSDTTGEKPCEEFYTDSEQPDLQRFADIGIVKNQLQISPHQLTEFLDDLQALRQRGSWQRQELIQLVQQVLPDFSHKETGKFLDSKM